MFHEYINIVFSEKIGSRKSDFLKNMIIFSFAFSAFFLIAFTLRFAWASAISLDNQSAKTGETVTFTVTIDPASSKIDAFGFDINFDSRVLRYTGFSAGAISREFDFFDVSNPAENLVRIGGFTINPLKIEQLEELVYLNFVCLSCTEAESVLEISKKVDDSKKWESRSGIFTCLTETNTEETDILQDILTETEEEKTDMNTKGTVKTSSLYVQRDKKEVYNTNKRKNIPYNTNNIKGKSPQQAIGGKPLLPDKTGKNGTADQMRMKKPGLAQVYKEPSQNEPLKPPEKDIFDASALSASLKARYGDIPTVQAVFPEDGSSLIPGDIPFIKAVFTQSMDNATVENAFIINPHVEGRFKWGNNLTEMEFIPYSPLSPGISYSVHITDSAKDLYGRSLDGDLDGKMGGKFLFAFKTKREPENICTVQEALPVSPKVSRCFIMTAY